MRISSQIYDVTSCDKNRTLFVLSLGQMFVLVCVGGGMSGERPKGVVKIEVIILKSIPGCYYNVYSMHVLYS